jgi:hypothetical protein
MRWRKSSRSNGTGGACVQVARVGAGRIAARDSKNPEGPRLRFDRPAFGRLLDEIKAGRHDIR